MNGAKKNIRKETKNFLLTTTLVSFTSTNAVTIPKILNSTYTPRYQLRKNVPNSARQKHKYNGCKLLYTDQWEHNAPNMRLLCSDFPEVTLAPMPPRGRVTTQHLFTQKTEAWYTLFVVGRLKYLLRLMIPLYYVR